MCKGRKRCIGKNEVWREGGRERCVKGRRGVEGRRAVCREEGREG